MSETNFEDLINMILKDDMQKTISEDCRKIFPISMVEIRKSEVMGG